MASNRSEVEKLAITYGVELRNFVICEICGKREGWLVKVSPTSGIWREGEGSTIQEATLSALTKLPTASTSRASSTAFER